MNTETFESFMNEFLETDNISEGGQPRSFADRFKRKIDKWGKQVFSPDGVITIIFTTSNALNPVTQIAGTENDKLKTMDKIKDLLADNDSANRNKLLVDEFRSGKSEYIIDKRVLYKYIFGKSYSMLSGGKEAMLTGAVAESIRKTRSDLFDDVFGPRSSNFKKLDINRKLQFLSQTIGIVLDEQNKIRDPDVLNTLNDTKTYLDSKISQMGGNDDVLDNELIYGGALQNKILFKGLNITWDNDVSMLEALKQINNNPTTKLENITFDKVLVLKEQKDNAAVIVKLL